MRCIQYYLVSLSAIRRSGVVTFSLQRDERQR